MPHASVFLPEVIQWIQSRRATGVMSAHVALASPSTGKKNGVRFTSTNWISEPDPVRFLRTCRTVRAG